MTTEYDTRTHLNCPDKATLAMYRCDFFNFTESKHIFIKIQIYSDDILTHSFEDLADTL